MMTLIIGLVVAMFIMGVIDQAHESFKSTTEYESIMDNYYADVRRIERM